jgi:hypothetical protein
VDLEVRSHVYRRFVELGRAPSFAELSVELDRDVAPAMLELHDARAIVLGPERDRILMAHPFSALPTVHRVRAAGQRWYANCAWNAFGVLAALGVNGRVSSTCADCGTPVEIEVRWGVPVNDNHLVHFNVPIAQWWDDIVFT